SYAAYREGRGRVWRLRSHDRPAIRRTRRTGGRRVDDAVGKAAAEFPHVAGGGPRSADDDSRAPGPLAGDGTVGNDSQRLGPGGGLPWVRVPALPALHGQLPRRTVGSVCVAREPRRLDGGGTANHYLRCGRRHFVCYRVELRHDGTDGA